MEFAISELVGLVEGLALDYELTDLELDTLSKWLLRHSDSLAKEPFYDLALKVESAVRQKALGKEDAEELLDFCHWFAVHLRSDSDSGQQLARLTGLMAGLTADGRVTEQEIVDLSDWLHENEHMSALPAFRRIFAAVSSALEDGVIDERERTHIETICNALAEVREHPVTEDGG